ncbi:hypothetical protein V1527DRAFT_465530 [Lipomyces starkeyi]
MDWSETPTIGQKVLECVQQAQKLNLEEWTTKPYSCTSIPFLSLKLGIRTNVLSAWQTVDGCGK